MLSLGAWPIFDVSPDGRSALDPTNGLSLRPVDGGPAKRIPLDPSLGAYVTGADFSPDGRAIATADPSGGLWVARRDGSELRRLAVAATGTSWSPDGRSLAFTAPGPRGVGKLVVAAASGTHTLTIAPARSYQRPVWSPRGDWIAYVSKEDELDLIKPDGSGHRRLGPGSNPSWSPDGSRLVVDRPFPADPGPTRVWRGLAVLDLHGKRLHLFEYRDAGLPAWSPRGDQIAYATTDSLGRTQLFAVRADGTQKRELTHDPDLPGNLWSGDLDWIRWVTQGPNAGRELFYSRTFCDDPTQ